MATITVGNTTKIKRVIADNQTIVKSIVVGTPVRRVTAGAFIIDDVGGVDTTGATNGSLLIYDSTTGLWTASLDLENQNINGGSY